MKKSLLALISAITINSYSMQFSRRTFDTSLKRLIVLRKFSTYKKPLEKTFAKKAFIIAGVGAIGSGGLYFYYQKSDNKNVASKSILISSNQFLKVTSSEKYLSIKCACGKRKFSLTANNGGSSELNGNCNCKFDLSTIHDTKCNLKVTGSENSFEIKCPCGKTKYHIEMGNSISIVSTNHCNCKLDFSGIKI